MTKSKGIIPYKPRPWIYKGGQEEALHRFRKSTPKLEVVIDREKLAKLIQSLEDKYEDYCIRFKLQSDIRTFGEYIADAIINAAKTDNSLMRIEVVKEESK